MGDVFIASASSLSFIFLFLLFLSTISSISILGDDTYSIVTSAEGAEDGVARFTSLVRARD